MYISFLVFKKRRGGGGAFDASPQSRDGQKSPVWIGLKSKDKKKKKRDSDGYPLSGQLPWRQSEFISRYACMDVVIQNKSMTFALYVQIAPLTTQKQLCLSV